MFENKVTLEPIHHVYTHENGKQYKSVSKVIERFKNVFDKEQMSLLSAKKSLRLHGIPYPTDQELQQRKQELLVEWAENNKLACDIGTYIHDQLDLYGKTTKINDAKLESMIRSVYQELSEYKKYWNELCLYADDFEVAGTADKVLLRPTTRNTIDIVDYKTNISKGIQYTSKHKMWMKPPFDHLEDCNFNHYALQLSMYAFMIEHQYGYKVGSLKLLFIPPQNPLAWKFIPLTYHKYEAGVLLQSHLNPRLENLEHAES